MQIMKNGLKGYKTLKSGDGRIFTFGRKPSLEHLLTKSQEQHLAGLACGYTGCECVCVNVYDPSSPCKFSPGPLLFVGSVLVVKLPA